MVSLLFHQGDKILTKYITSNLGGMFEKEIDSCIGKSCSKFYGYGL